MSFVLPPRCPELLRTRIDLGWTPLQVACYWHKEAIALFLLDKEKERVKADREHACTTVRTFVIFRGHLIWMRKQSRLHPGIE